MPELVPEGPRIPVHLMNEVDEGSVVFFCGAGGSVGDGSNLPNFEELVEHVYEANRIEADEVEHEALHRDEPDRSRRRPQFDKALGLLERSDRLGPEALRGTVIERLSRPATAPLRVHEASGIASVFPVVELGARLSMTHLDGTGDGNLVVNTTAFPTRSPANPGFVHLNMVLGLSTDPVLVGPHHARAELVENLKGRLVARKTKLPLKLHGGHAGRLTGDQISGPEPDVQRSVATLHHCSHRQPGVLAALAAAQDARAVFKVERLSRRAAVRAGKAVSPAGFLQVGGAGRIIGEKSLELG